MGLKCPNIDVEAKWKSVLEKAESRKQGLDRVLAIVTESAEEIVGGFSALLRYDSEHSVCYS